ncbi:MAG: IS200/IS605 family transposase [Candidatus Cloacimonetes bacterium]|nr:IS200/IS605 family transposase [Candidatus Cloacimonadota bacterium]
MADSYTNIYIHYVMATYARVPVLFEEKQDELYSYIAGIIRGLGCFVHCIGGVEDHVHILIGLNPAKSIAEVAQKIKANSSRFINQQNWLPGKFSWQGGYAAFSVSASMREKVRTYIKNQKEHHKKLNFMDEYFSLLEKHGIEYNRQHLFHRPE